MAVFVEPCLCTVGRSYTFTYDVNYSPHSNLHWSPLGAVPGLATSEMYSGQSLTTHLSNWQ